MLSGRLIIGGPGYCREQIAACRARIPIGCLILRMQWMGLPHTRAWPARSRWSARSCCPS